MKKIIVIAVVAVLVLSLFAGCAPKIEQKTPVGTWESYSIENFEGDDLEEQAETLSVSLTVNEDGTGEFSQKSFKYSFTLPVTVEGNKLICGEFDSDNIGITSCELEFSTAENMLVLRVKEKTAEGESVSYTALCLKGGADSKVYIESEKLPENTVPVTLSGNTVIISVLEVSLATEIIGNLEVKLGGININTPGWRELKVFAVDSYGSNILLPVTTATEDGFTVASEGLYYGLPEKLIIGSGDNVETDGYIYYVSGGVFHDEFCFEWNDHTMRVESTQDDGSITNGSTEPEGKYVKVTLRCIDGTLTFDEISSNYSDVILYDKDDVKYYAVSTGFEAEEEVSLSLSDLENSNFVALSPIFDIPADQSVKDCSIYVGGYVFWLEDIPMNVPETE